MRPDQDNIWDALKVQAKSLFFHRLYYHHEHKVDSINARESLELDNGSKVRNLTRQQWKHLSYLLQKPAQELEVKRNRINIEIDDSEYIVLYGQVIEGFKSIFSDDNVFQEALQTIDVANQIIIDSVLTQSIADVARLIEPYTLNRVNETNKGDEQEIWLNANRDFYRNLRLLAFRAYVRPFLNESIPESQKQQGILIFNTIDNELRTNPLAKKHYLLLDHILNQTVEGLNGNLDVDQYYRLLQDLPKKRSWGKIIRYTCLAFLAAIFLTASIYLTIISFGLVAPLTLLGITVGLNYLVGTYSVATGVVALGMFSSAVIVAAKGEKTVIEEECDRYLAEYANAVLAM